MMLFLSFIFVPLVTGFDVAHTAIGMRASTTHNSHKSVWDLVKHKGDPKQESVYDREYWMSRDVDDEAQITITLPRVHDIYQVITRGPNSKRFDVFQYAFEAIHVDAWVNVGGRMGWKRVIAEGAGEPVDEKALCSTFGKVRRFYDTGYKEFENADRVWMFRTMDESFQFYKRVKTNKLRITLKRHCPVPDTTQTRYLRDVKGIRVKNVHYALSHIEIDAL